MDQTVPQDIVAIFHASFHPTQGNIIDWSLKVDDDIDLSHVEFSCLPSGLHSVEEDVVYFTKDDFQGVCVFQRRKTTEHGHRGFRLSSLGILLAKTTRSRPWRHVTALKSLCRTIYSSIENRDVLEPNESDWNPAKLFFEERKALHVDSGDAGDWNGWDAEIDVDDVEVCSPTLHLPHLVRVLGPSSLTLYKHILGRRRVLIFTQPPVEAACVLCQVAADICFEEQLGLVDPQTKQRLRGRVQAGIRVFGMVTLSDLDKLKAASMNDNGWVACTTDALFLEKPEFYDLLIDLTTTQTKSTRPSLSLPKPDSLSSRKLSTIRFTWSDIKLWTELDRLLQIDAEGSDNSCCSTTKSFNKQKVSGTPAWPDLGRVYEDVCIICAGLWLTPWKTNGRADNNWGSIRLPGDDALSTHTGGSSNTYSRNAGMRRDSRRFASTGVSEEGVLLNRSARSTRRSSRSSIWTWTSGRGTQISLPQMKDLHEGDEDDQTIMPRRRAEMTLMILKTFQANTDNLISRLADILPPRPMHSHHMASTGTDAPIVLTPKDLMAFDLGPLSGLDARFIEWLVEVYGNGTRVVVRRGWRDIVALIFGLG